MVSNLIFLTHLTRTKYGQDFLWKISRLSADPEPGQIVCTSLNPDHADSLVWPIIDTPAGQPQEIAHFYRAVEDRLVNSRWRGFRVGAHSFRHARR